jgi:protein-S-isoprenylcysteine O-methyltransferase Ste14
VKIPGIGALVELIHTTIGDGVRTWLASWRSDSKLVHAYVVTTWVWIGMFAARLLVQVPLYLGNSVGFLGTARLVMGVPLFALTIWISWVFISPQIRRVDFEKTREGTAEKADEASMTGEDVHD